MLTRTCIGALVAGLLLAPLPVKAASFPDGRTVTIVVPFLAGGGNDVLSRVVAAELTKRFGSSVIVENRPGGGSIPGIAAVAKSKPDGHTMVWSPSDGISILPVLKKSMPYKVPDDFDFVMRTVVMPGVFAINSKLPIKSMKELIEYAKKNPGAIRFGSSGVGGSLHMSAVLFQQAAGIELSHVPYSGVSGAVNDVMGGHIEAIMITPQTIKPYADAEKVRVLATTGAKRDPLFPDVPTLKEAGIDVQIDIWYGILAPKGIPADTMKFLRSEIAAVLKEPSVVEKFTKLGYQISTLDGDAFKDYVTKDMNRWREIAEKAKISLDN